MIAGWERNDGQVTPGPMSPRVCSAAAVMNDQTNDACPCCGTQGWTWSDEMLEPEMLPWQQRALSGGPDEEIEECCHQARKEEHKPSEEGKRIILQRVILHESS